MNKNRKRIAFIIVVTVIAFAETAMWNGFRQRWAARKEQRQLAIQNQAVAEQAGAKAAAEHARYLAQYVSIGFTRTHGMKTVAVMTASENGRLNEAVNAAIAKRCNSDSVEILPAFLKSEFVSDGLLNDAFTNSKQVFKKLELSKSIDALLLARQTVRYTSNPSLENVLSATMELEVAVFPSNNSAQGQTWKFAAVGSGFKQEDARAMAEERIIKQIAGDTQMSLASISSSNQ